MKKMPSRGSHKEQLGGSSHSSAEVIMNGKSEIWIDRGLAPSDSNVLVTLSSADGERTVLVTPNVIVDSSAKLFVSTPPERVPGPHEAKIRRLKIVMTYFGYAAIALMVTFSALSASGTMKARIVLTNSMEPAISPGDIVLTMSPERLSPKIGMVAAYQGRRFDGSPVGVFSHRIIDGNADQGWVMKGDNNPSPDTQTPKNDDILGVVFFVIPFIGKFLTKEAILIMAPIGVAIWMAIDSLRGSDEE